MIRMRHKKAVFVVIALVVVFLGYTLFSIFAPPHTLAQSDYKNRGVAYEQVEFTNGHMSSTYKLTGKAPNIPIGTSSSFAVGVSIQKTRQILSSPYTDSSFYINNATLRFPDGTSSTSFQVHQVNQTMIELVFNSQTYVKSGNITMQMYISFTPAWDISIYHIPSQNQIVTVDIPLEVI